MYKLSKIFLIIIIILAIFLIIVINDNINKVNIIKSNFKDRLTQEKYLYEANTKIDELEKKIDSINKDNMNNNTTR